MSSNVQGLVSRDAKRPNAAAAAEARSKGQGSTQQQNKQKQQQQQQKQKLQAQKKKQQQDLKKKKKAAAAEEEWSLNDDELLASIAAAQAASEAETDVLQPDPKFLDPQSELKRIFGGNVVKAAMREEQQERRASSGRRGRGGAPARLRRAILVQQRDQHACARSANRMPDGDGAAIDVDDLRVPAHVAIDRDGLGGEGLVGFDQLDLVDAPAGPLQRLAAGRDWA